jgi:hypothetical protein
LTEGAFVTLLTRKSQSDELCGLTENCGLLEDIRDYFVYEITDHITDLARDTQVTTHSWSGTHRSHHTAGQGYTGHITELVRDTQVTSQSWSGTHRSHHRAGQEHTCHITVLVRSRMYLCVLCGSENKQRLFPYTTLTDWFV